MSQPIPTSPQDVQLHADSLVGASHRDEFELHNLALEWGIAEPIVIHDESDMKARTTWKNRFDPFEHQVQNLITFCRRLPVSIIADDVGLGKTISAGLILSELIVRRRVNRCLVICTRLIAPQWIDELQSKFGIDGKWATGSLVRGILAGDATVVATSYDSARDYMSEIRAAGFDMLILDEAHKLRNLYGANSPPRMATEIRKALESRVFKFVLMLTATPMQNRIWDLYSLIDCLSVAKGHNNPFGNPSQFSTRFGNAFKFPGWSATHQGIEFRNTLRQYLVRTRRATVRLSFPKRILELRKVPATHFDRKLMAVIANELDRSVKGKSFLTASLGIAMMSSPQALRKQLQNMAEREPEWLPACRDVEDIVSRYVMPSKLEALLDICRRLSLERPADWRVVVFTCRSETLDLITSQLTQSGFQVGMIRGGCGNQNQQAIEAYSCQPPKLNVLVSTDTGAEGVNLQAGNVMVNYDLPWNPMVVEQRIGRIQRLGSKFRNVVVLNLAVADSPEDRIVARLLQKLIEISESIGDIESILEAASESSGANRSVEEQITEMVRKALQGQNVEKERALAEESILNAKRQLEENEKEINERLGDLSELHHTGARPPDLLHTVPSRPFKEFVFDALSRLGHRISPRPEYGVDVFSVTYARAKQEVLVVFEREQWKTLKADLPGRVVELYQPGQPAFERLLQAWRESSQACVVSTRQLTEPMARELVDGWANQIRGARVVNVQFSNRHSRFQGTVRCLVRASNGVDQYEKLLTHDYRQRGDNPIESQVAELTTTMLPSFDLSRYRDLLREVRSAVVHDPDVSKFKDFYNQRLEEELPRAGDSLQRRKKLTDDFSVNVEASTVASAGIEYEICDAKVTVCLDDLANYEVSFQLIPATGQIVSEPPVWEFCERSGQEYPSEFIGCCEYSGQRAVRHMLRKSEISSRAVLPEYLEVCCRTGKRAVVDEFSASSLSRVRAISSQFVRSGISERVYFPEEMSSCEFSSIRVGSDELMVSEISLRRFRSDQSQRCSVSGQSGHSSEFSSCEVTGKPVCEQELGTSSVSGRKVARNLLRPSERDPSRLGLTEEFVTCEVSGRQVLTDEAAQCSITGLLVDDTLLKRCPETAVRLLEEKMELCHATGLRCSPTALTTCAVTKRRVLNRLCSASAVSGLPALSGELRRCEITEVSVLPNELLQSDYSGKVVRFDEVVVSAVTGRRGHQSESVFCAISGQVLLLDEVSYSEISGRPAKKQLLVNCAITRKLALPDELQRCEFTGLTVVPEELFVSDSSRKKCVRTEQSVSEASGKKGHHTEFGNCELTWKHVLLSELIECSISGKKVLASECRTSVVSGRSIIASLARNCEISQAFVLPAERTRSSVSALMFRSDEAVTSEKSGRVAHKSESRKCAITERVLLSDEVSQSAISGITADSDFFSKCSVTAILALTAELAKSDFSDALAVPSEMRLSAVSGRRFTTQECFVSEVSGETGHLSEVVVCQVTGKRVLANEVVRCAVSGTFALPSECSTSDLSGRMAIKGECFRCDFTEVRVLSDELEFSDVSGRRIRCDQVVVSSVSGRRGHRTEGIRCDYSGRQLLIDEIATSDYSGKITAACELSRSELSQRRGTATEFVVCAGSGRQLLKDEVGKSEVSGLIYDQDLLVASDRSGLLALRDELVVCHKSRRRLLPTETGVSAASGDRFDSELLRMSDFSEALALPEEMKSCVVCGKTGLPNEGFTCAESGDWLGKCHITTCTVTKRKYRPDLCVRSAVSHRWMHHKAARRSFRSGHWLHPDEAKFCHWNGRFLRPEESRTCSRTGLTFAADLIDSTGQFSKLLPLMFGEILPLDGTHYLSALQKAHPASLKRTYKLAFIRRTPTSRICFFRALILSRFRIDLYKVAFVARITGDSIKIISPLTRQLEDGAWEAFP